MCWLGCRSQPPLHCSAFKMLPRDWSVVSVGPWSWSRDAGFIRAALASCRTTGDFQTVYSRVGYLIHTGCSPSYMSDLSTSTSSIASRSLLRSASSRRYEQPATTLKLGERSFAFAGPAVWNSLPTSLHGITNHKAFKRELKTVLFKRAYSA